MSIGEEENSMKKGDYKAEAIFIGDIVGATNYSGDGELYADILIEASEQWELITASTNSFTTQACEKNVTYSSGRRVLHMVAPIRTPL